MLGVSDVSLTAAETPALGVSGWYDGNGHQVCYKNGTETGEAGYVVWRRSGNPTVPFWKNATNEYIIYNTATGDYRPELDFTFGAWDAIGLVALIAALTALSVVAGLHFFGSGTSDISVGAIFKGTGYVFLWATFSALSFSLISSIPSFMGYGFYFFLTVLYVLGIINSVGSPGSE